ncbi:hypothetical protein GALL_381810 [mine drainage metagenome]|uniref:Uncharacterized protein n=1 Tax=mine drainage metagenome TaxID=410659 RepID=A0A1J5QJC0_9ZZZZ
MEPGHDPEEGEVPHPVVTRAVVTGDPGAVEHERHSGLVQGHVHQHLVERAIEERRIQGDDRMEPRERHPGRRGRGVLLGDTDVERAGRELLSERREADRREHRGGDRDDVGSPVPDPDDLVREDRRPAEARRRERQAGLRVDLAHRVEPVRDVLLSRRVPAALLGDDVHDHRCAEGLRPDEGVLDRRLVVTVDRADVLDAEVLEHALRRDDVLDALLEAVQGVVREPPRDARPLQRVLAPGQHLLVAVGGAQRVEMVREPADGGRVGPSVVVHDDHETSVLTLRDVVERLPGHATGQGTVSDHRDHVTVVAPPQHVGLGDPVRPAQCRGRVRVLDDVVGRLGAARIPGEAAALAELAEVLAAGEQLVDVRLVPGVEHDRVARGLEHPVQGDRELHHAEVRSQVPPRPGHGLDQELADLRGEADDLAVVEPADVGWRRDAIEQAHARALPPTATSPQDADVERQSPTVERADAGRCARQRPRPRRTSRVGPTHRVPVTTRRRRCGTGRRGTGRRAGCRSRPRRGRSVHTRSP